MGYEVSFPITSVIQRTESRLTQLYLLPSYDFTNKKIGIIGNGSSAIQIIPSLQKVQDTQLSCFMRSPTWISFSFGDHAMMNLGLDPTVTESKL